jgi:hypothetical protein
MSYEDKVARLNELVDLQTDHELAIDAIISEIEDLEYEIEQENEATWADDMNATLMDIGSYT